MGSHAVSTGVCRIVARVSETSVYDVWLGADDEWRPWVKHALLSSLVGRPVTERAAAESGEAPPWLGQDLSWLCIDEAQNGNSVYRDRTKKARCNVAILVDLPGRAAIEMGLALGHAGWRPVLSINATSSEYEVIDMGSIVSWLEKGARFGSSFLATPKAAPVFILDSRRDGRNMRIAPGRFDNRWTVYASDLPSGRKLKEAEIEQVVVLQEGTQMKDDIAAIAWAYERAGLEVRQANMRDRSLSGMPGKPQGWLGFAVGQLERRLGLKRRSDGSYGHRIPIPPEPSHG